MLKTKKKSKFVIKYAPGGTHPLFLHPFLSFFTPDVKKKTVLDVGCGRGLNGSIIRATRDWTGATLIGMDINKGCLEFCKEFNIYDKLLEASLPKLPFKDKSIDFLLCTEVIEHLKKKDGLTLLKEIDRVCKGRAIVSTPNLFFDTLEANKEDEHKSIWSAKDFRKYGYKAYGLGLRTPLLLGDKILRIKQALYYLFTPLSYFIPELVVDFCVLKTMPKTLIIGQTSFVASNVIENLKDAVVPSLDEVDITDIDSIRSFAEKVEFDTVVNFAAYTNVKEVTLDKDGLGWKLNVEGAGNVAKVCKEKNKFLIHVSTDSVFPVTPDSLGPHSETEEIKDDPNFFSPYGYTKLMGEKEVVNSGARAAILRIAYPFGNAKFPEKDYITKLINSMKLGYPLFADQKFTPTYLKSLPAVIEKLSKDQLIGIFHWVCKDVTTPYDIGVYVNDRLDLGLEVKKGSLAEYEKLKGPQPYAMFGGLSTEITEEKLGLKSIFWKEAIDDFLPELKSHL